MSIPLRELALVLCLLPTAMGGAAAFNAGVSRLDTFLFECDHFEDGPPRSCSQEELLAVWDVQLQRIAESHRRALPARGSPGEMTLLASEPP